MVKLPEEILYDVRLVERHIRQGLITRADYDAHVKKLADAAEHADDLDMDELSGAEGASENSPS